MRPTAYTYIISRHCILDTRTYIHNNIETSTFGHWLNGWKMMQCCHLLRKQRRKTIAFSFESVRCNHSIHHLQCPSKEHLQEWPVWWINPTDTIALISNSTGWSTKKVLPFILFFIISVCWIAYKMDQMRIKMLISYPKENRARRRIDSSNTDYVC